jgi:AraC-like DNA-binding protein
MMRSRIESNRLISSIDWDVQPLGVISDLELSRQLSVSNSTVKRRREVRQIPLSEAGENIANGRAFIATIDWTKQPLGIISDMRLAKMLGCSRRTVARHRERLGINFKREKRTDRISIQVERSLNEKLFLLAKKKKMPVATLLYLAAKKMVEGD